MGVRDAPKRTISPSDLADWLERYPDHWWTVDGDHRLTREVDFPCPSEELAEALRKIEVPLHYHSTGWIGPKASERHSLVKPFDDLPDQENREDAVAMTFSWADQPDLWLLYEYIPLRMERFKE